MENNYIKIKGKIVFDPVNKTKKHESQAEWKQMAMIMLEDETKTEELFIFENGKSKYVGITAYYNSLLKKRYNFTLNKPLRGAHISFINDSIRDIKAGMNCSETEAMQAWEELSLKWNGKEIDVYLDVSSIETKDGKHWWLIVPQEEREEIHSIRKEIGLERPFFGLHMSVGYANERNIEQSEYIFRGIRDNYIN